MKTNVLLLAALALAACSPDFDPASKVEKMRVLAVKAEPPEIEPSGTATLGALVVRSDFASDRAHPTTVVYLACVPVPGYPGATSCEALASLRDPTAALAAAAEASCSAPPDPGSGSPPPNEIVALAGIEACDAVGTSPCAQVLLPDATPLPGPALTIPSQYASLLTSRFDALAAGSPDRILGVQADVLAFALDAAPAEIVEGATGACPLASIASRFSSLWSSREHVLSIKRVQIRGPEAKNERNLNPGFGGIAAGKTALEGSATALPAADVDLSPTGVQTALVQDYLKLDAAGVAVESAREDWVYSWFSTAGELEDLHTRVPDAERWKLAGASGGPALVAAVVRDLRGGVAWQVREVELQP